ncbi:hypothetical protein NFI96_009931 [Prochilodus magdalenae]|nr:hypothetical protein NFI96_009931 [Prochilodus magdalenae]
MLCDQDIVKERFPQGNFKDTSIMPQNNESTFIEFFIMGFPGLRPEYYNLIGAIFFIIYVIIIMGNSIVIVLFDLSNSDIRDSGVQPLSAGVKSSQSELDILSIF